MHRFERATQTEHFNPSLTDTKQRFATKKLFKLKIFFERDLPSVDFRKWQSNNFFVFFPSRSGFRNKKVFLDHIFATLCVCNTNERFSPHTGPFFGKKSPNNVALICSFDFLALKFCSRTQSGIVCFLSNLKNASQAWDLKSRLPSQRPYKLDFCAPF